jgi:hypothetical protein
LGEAENACSNGCSRYSRLVCSARFRLADDHVLAVGKPPSLSAPHDFARNSARWKAIALEVFLPQWLLDEVSLD